MDDHFQNPFWFPKHYLVEAFPVPVSVLVPALVPVPAPFPFPLQVPVSFAPFVFLPFQKILLSDHAF